VEAAEVLRISPYRLLLLQFIFSIYCSASSLFSNLVVIIKAFPERSFIRVPLAASFLFIVE
jgi:hypothetical protein